MAEVGNGHRGHLEPFGPARLGRPTGPLWAAHRTGGTFPALLRDATNKAYDKASQTAEAVMEELDEQEGDLAGDLQ